MDVPPEDNSAMDGYALRAEDAGLALPVSQRIAAGDALEPLQPGTAARLFTGAEIPPGADAVVLQEDCKAQGEVVLVPPDIDAGQHIRQRGQDLSAGDLMLKEGRRLLPQDLGLLASQGMAQVTVFRRLRVALLSTGNELREAGSGALLAGQIYNSNRPMLHSLLQGMGCTVIDLGNVADTAEATANALREAAAADLIISSGGVSVGEADHVRDQVEALGAIDLWRVAIKPGKPFAFGRVGNTPFIGLPGNPVSSFVTCLVLARPYIAALQGRVLHATLPVTARADFSRERAGSRTEFLRARLERRGGELWGIPFANQSSGVLSSVSAGNALVIVTRGRTVSHGDPVDALLLSDLLS